MKVTLFLADAAQAQTDGKVSALGMGWSTAPTPTPPHAVVALFHFLADERPPTRWQLDLQNGDGTPTILENSALGLLLGPNTLHVEQDLVYEIQDGHQPDVPLMVPVVVSLGPLPLAPGSAFKWVLTVGDDIWVAPFWTRPELKTRA